MIKLLVFDFDGTLVDSKKVIYHAIKTEVNHDGYSLSRKFKNDMGDWPLALHLKKEGIIKDRKEVIKRIKHHIYLEQKEITLAKNIRDLSKIRMTKIILSNNSGEFIKRFLRTRKIGFFKEIHGPKEFHNKAEGLQRILEEKNLKPGEIIYIGDRDLDIMAAKKVGCVAIAIYNEISWSKRKDILDSGPDFIISNLAELRDIVKKLNAS